MLADVRAQAAQDEGGVLTSCVAFKPRRGVTKACAEETAYFALLIMSASPKVLRGSQSTDRWRSELVVHTKADMSCSLIYGQVKIPNVQLWILHRDKKTPSSPHVVP